jgi:hypothetical protein
MSCIVALITTPPPTPDILDYGQRGAYICLLASFVILLGGIIVGSTDIYVMGTSSPQWVYRVSNFVTANKTTFLVAVFFSSHIYPLFPTDHCVSDTATYGDTYAHRVSPRLPCVSVLRRRDCNSCSRIG